MAVDYPLTRFSRFGANLGRLTLVGTDALVWTEALDGTDQLVIRCLEDVAKGERIVWCDAQGVWHEHVVDEPKRVHDSTGRPVTEATCINSICETWDDYVEDIVPHGNSTVHMTRILTGTRWSPGNSDITTSLSKTYYHESVREAIKECCDLFGGELVTSVTTDANGVKARTAAIVTARGNQLSAKRFVWRKDLQSVTRTVLSEDVKTRVYGYGKGVETGTGGYGRRLTLEDANGGKKYVEDAAATKVWGHPGPNGTVLPAVGTFVDEECDDAAALLAETKAYLAKVSQPQVSYEANAVDLADFGRSWEEFALGDSVAIVDDEFGERAGDGGLQLRGRVSKVERNLLTHETKVTFGTITDDLTTRFASIGQSLRSASYRNASVDAIAGLPASYLNQLMSAINNQFEASGTYRYTSFDRGDIWSNVPLDGNGNATTSVNAWAININGAGLRIANSLNADGTWNWRTFGTGAGFTADEINAGTLDADLIKTGSLLVGGTNKVSKVLLYNGSNINFGSIDDLGILVGGTNPVSGDTTYLNLRPGLFNGMSITSVDPSTHVPSDGVAIGPTGIVVGESSVGLPPQANYKAVAISPSTISLKGDTMVDVQIKLDRTGGLYVRSGLSKSGILDTKDYGTRALYCYEMTSPTYGDLGEGEVGDDGASYVQLDPVFSECVLTDQYQVFLQPYGDGKCYVAERHSTYFVVKGTAGLSFGWELKAKNRDYNLKRLNTFVPTKASKDDTNYGGQAMNHIDQIAKERSQK